MDIMRKDFTVGFAGLLIEIETVSTCVCVFCRDYFQDGQPDFKVQITEDDIGKEIEESSLVRPDKVTAELTAAHRKIVEKAIDYNVFLMHGAVIALGEESYMFSAPSGTGKTTHIKLWLQHVDDSIVVNGDKPMVRIVDDDVMVCGTPWSGSEHLHTNVIKPLKAIVFMERGESNHIEEIDFSEAYPHLLEQTYIPRDLEKAKKVLALISSMYKKVSFYRFQCNNLKDDCFKTAYNGLVKSEENKVE